MNIKSFEWWLEYYKLPYIDSTTFSNWHSIKRVLMCPAGDLGIVFLAIIAVGAIVMSVKVMHEEGMKQRW